MFCDVNFFKLYVYTSSSILSLATVPRCGESIRGKYMVEGVDKKSWCLTVFNDEVVAIVSGESGE